jgi:hypothetical protein
MLEDCKDKRSLRIKKKKKNEHKKKELKKYGKNERDNKFVWVEGNFVCKLVKKEMVKICGKSIMPNFIFIDVNIGHFKLFCSQC